MKKIDILFWVLLVSIALFYFLKGNDMYKDKWDHRKSVFTQDQNKTIPPK
ncbi:MAG: hypothetical protein U9Q04_06245 [Campylobacterota bacterium]|nr:hypothetical protein [Campylobacterota bacterium]